MTKIQVNQNFGIFEGKSYLQSKKDFFYWARRDCRIHMVINCLIWLASAGCKEITATATLDLRCTGLKFSVFSKTGKLNPNWLCVWEHRNTVLCQKYEDFYWKSLALQKFKYCHSHPISRCGSYNLWWWCCCCHCCCCSRQVDSPEQNRQSGHKRLEIVVPVVFCVGLEAHVPEHLRGNGGKVFFARDNFLRRVKVDLPTRLLALSNSVIPFLLLWESSVCWP